MQWLYANHPERGFLLSDVQEPRVDGIPKLTARIVASYRVINDSTVHAKVFDQTETAIIHEVFPDILQAQLFILKNVLSEADSSPELAPQT